MRWFLGFSAAIWLPYGVFCFLQPGFLQEAAGVASGSPTGTIELRAMYGGLQAAIGALALGALLRPSLLRPALVMLAFVGGGLALGRAGGALIEAELSAYTAMGLLLEVATVGLASWLLWASASNPSA